MRCKKLGLIYHREIKSNWWESHTMAPSALLINKEIIRVFLGCWDRNKISRIGYIDVDATNPLKILNISKNAVLNIGENGTFDENGVFPAHANKINNKIYLYYTGFQLGFKIRHYNFGGLAISNDNGNSFFRYSKSPILDRSDEGLFVRAGQSTIKVLDKYVSVYSSGSNWSNIGGKYRPCYDIFLQKSDDAIRLKNEGNKIIKYDPKREHGVGRPQIFCHNNVYYIFYTIRDISMKYRIGYAISDNLENWERKDDLDIKHSKSGWDSEMVYFPSVLKSNGKIFLFYCGNNFGQAGFGVAELINF